MNWNENVKKIPNFNPHKLFPDNPVPYSHIWEITNEAGEEFTIDWDTQTVAYRPIQFPEDVHFYKITYARFQRNPLSPGLYLKVNHETTQFRLVEHSRKLLIDGKNYIPFFKIEPTPGRELPPLDNPNAEWTGFVTNGFCDLTDEEQDYNAFHQLQIAEKLRFEGKRKEREALKLLSKEQKEGMARKKPGYEKVAEMCVDYITGLRDNIDPNFVPWEEEEEQVKDDHDFDLSDE